MITEEEIARFIVSTVASNRRITGAALGSKVNQQFPGVVVGKLTQFIKQHCGSSIESVGGIGLDYVWDLKSTGGVPSNSLPQPPSQPVVLPHSNPPEIPAWKVFTRHDKPGNLAINPITGGVVVAKSREEIVSPLIEIASVTADEYRDIALRFIAQVEPADQGELKRLALSPLFELQWFEILQGFRDGYYNKAWGTYRFQELCDIFRKRLRSKEIPDGIIETSLGNLKRMKTERKGPTFTIPSTPPAIAGSQFDSRELILSAVKRLSDEDLRRIWLPIGAVLDALGKKQLH